MIDLMPSEEQEELLAWASGLLDREVPAGSLLKESLDTFPIAEVARSLGDAGLLGLTATRVQPSAGLKLADEALVFREMGRRIVPGPLIATVIAARLAESTGADEVATSLVQGQSLAGLAELRDDRRLVVWDAGPVDYILVLAGDTASLVRFDEFARLEFVDSIDPFHRMAIQDDCRVPEPVVRSNSEWARWLAHGRVLTAAFLSGLAEGARDHSAEYAKTRVQFGKPIGTFQAVKHRCADTALRAEAAWAQTTVAAIRLDDQGPAASELDVIAAKLVAGDAAIRNARDDIQNHGGMGYTFETEAHLYLKRAHVLSTVLGDLRSFTSLLLEGSINW